MPIGMENLMLLMGGDFELYFLLLKRSSGNRDSAPKIKYFSRVGMKVQAILWSIFLKDRGSNRVCDTGVS